MPDASFPLEQRVERFAHPAVRVMARELSHLARDVERGTLAWPETPPASMGTSTSLPGLEPIEAALSQQDTGATSAVNRSNWAAFARAVAGILRASSSIDPSPAASAPHPASIIALRLIWGAERFAELPTVILQPPPAPFLERLARVPAPERDTPPEQLDQTVFTWLQENQPRAETTAARLPASDVHGFARVVAACRAVGQLRQELTLEDGAVGYLAWARLLRADLEQLSNISSGWWSSARQPGR